MGHLLKLAQEYQAKGVLDLCVKCLQDVQKSEENVVKVLSLANCTVTTREDSRLDCVRGECNHLIKNMELSNVKGKGDFNHLDRDSLESLYVERTGRLETFLKEIYPQFVGLVEYSLHLNLQSSHCGITRCPQHFPLPGLSGKANRDLLDRLSSCSVCREMITQLVSSSVMPYPLHSEPNAASMSSETATNPVLAACTISRATTATMTATRRRSGSRTASLASTGSVFGSGTTSSAVTASGVNFGPTATNVPAGSVQVGFETTGSVSTGSGMFGFGTTASVSAGSGFSGSGTASSVGTGSVVGSVTTSSFGTGSLIGSGTTGSGFPGFGKQYQYGGSYHFDQKLISIIQDFKNVISLPSGTN